MKKKTVSILGSTGSIGQSTLSVIQQNQDKFKVWALSGHSNLAKLAEQTRIFMPQHVVLPQENKEAFLTYLGKYTLPLEIHDEKEGLVYISEHKEIDLVVAAIVGSIGVLPIMAAAKAGKTIALATKEAIVLAGELLTTTCHNTGATLLPVDSEHNAIFQCLQTDNKIESLTLTASGGPFYRTDLADFPSITLEQALKHPKWNMGKKITIDSATLMNKALEVIEAKWLFNIQANQVQVTIHPQAVIHSFVSFQDGSTLAQLGQADMRIPISYCLGYPKRIRSGCEPLKLDQLENLSFHSVDHSKFPTLNMAYRMLELGGGCCAAFNGANEAITEAFLNKQISFITIFSLLAKAIQHIEEQQKILPYLQKLETIEDALQANHWGSEYIRSILQNN